MKRILAILITMVMITTSFVGCGGNNSKEESPENSNSDKLSAEENLLSVEITIPSTFFEGQDVDKVVEGAKEKGVGEAKVNENGSVTYKMSKKVHKELLKSSKLNIDESIKKLLDDKETYPSFTEITYNDDVTEFNVYIDSAKYNDMQAFAVFGFYIVGNFYQVINCVPAEKIDTVVNFIDKDTKEIINSGKASDMQGN